VKLWLFNGLEATNQFLDVLALGLLLSPVAAGAYFVLTRLSNVFIIAHGAVQFYCSRHVPRLYFQRDTRQLDHYLRTVGLACGLLIPAGLLAIWIAGPYVLAIFGREYVQYSSLLLLLSLGTAAILGAGASGTILTFTGHEGWIGAIVAAAVSTRLLGFVLVVPVLQITGAALVTASSFILMSVALWYFTRRLTKLDGSVFCLLTRPATQGPLP
jgi:O-antigen/teichoic acid export membrane protein